MHSLRTFPCISFFGPYFRSYISQYHLFLPLLCLTLLYSATPYLTLPCLTSSLLPLSVTFPFLHISPLAFLTSHFPPLPLPFLLLTSLPLPLPFSHFPFSFLVCSDSLPYHSRKPPLQQRCLRNPKRYY